MEATNTDTATDVVKPNKPSEPEPTAENKKLTPVERKRIKRQNQRLRKKQLRKDANISSGTDKDDNSNGDGKDHRIEAQTESETPAPAKLTGGTAPAGKNKKNAKQAGRNTESFDPNSTLVTPSIRVYVASGKAREYGRSLKHDDTIIMPELFGEEGDMTTFDKLVEEISHLQKDGVKGADWTTWHQGAHMIAKDPKGSKTFQEIVDKLCNFFNVKKETAFARLYWYRTPKIGNLSTTILRKFGEQAQASR